MEDLATWRRRCAAEILGESKAIVRALDIIRRVARCGASVLLGGEAGTGKELFAHALHRGSHRAGGSFIVVDCAALPEQQLEERVASAAGGTLFLADVAELSLAGQARLLRVLDGELAAEVRVVAATHRDLDAMVEAGAFRADLYFRISVVPVQLPALRDRGADIELLAEAAIRRAVERGGRPVTLDDTARVALRAHRWQGNVRELQRVVERAVALAEGATLCDVDLDLAPARKAQLMVVRAAEVLELETLDLRAALEETERRLIRTALERSAGNRTSAAAMLGLNRTTLVEKLRRYA